jgi:hypothetical protein
MANTVKIKRSTTTATPILLAEGELAYSEQSGNLFIGTAGGNIANIGGVVGVKLQEYNAGIVIDESYVHTDNNFTSILKLKLNGIAENATANVGTVTSVALSVPTGLSVSNSPITSSGTLSISLATGYSIPTNIKQTNWDTAYSWFQVMSSADDADNVLNTWSELVNSLNNAGESINLLNNGSTIDGGSF